MNRIFHHSALLGRRLNWVVERTCALLVALMVIVVWVGVVSRYAIDLGVTWTEEFARYLMIWAALLAVSCGVYYREHVGLMLIKESLPPAIHRWFSLLLDLIGLAFFLILLVYGINMTREGAQQYATIFNMKMTLPYAAVPVSSALAALQVLLLAIRDFAKAALKEDISC